MKEDRGMINPPTTAAPSIFNEKHMEADGNDGKDGQNSRPCITLSGVDGRLLCI